MTKRTSLYELHLASGAKMVDFFDWEMPLHYGSLLEEHRQVRENAGMFDVSHMGIIDLQGSDVLVFLQYLLANDVRKITAPKAIYSCMLNHQGGILDDLIAYVFGSNRARLVVNAATFEKDRAWIESLVSAYQVTLTYPTLSLIAVQGPNSLGYVRQCYPDLSFDGKKSFDVLEATETLIAWTGYTGEKGVEIMLPHEDAAVLWQKLLACGVSPIGLGARDTLRLEAGLNLYGQDMDENTSPFECQLGWTVSLTDDRPFIGKEALMAQKKQGVTHQLVGILLEGPGVLRHHQSIQTSAGEGVILSGTFSPTLKKSIGFARVPVGARPHVQVTIRERQVPARLVVLPFIRHQKITYQEMS